MAATTCYIHPDKAANTSCENCNRPICPADHRSFVKRQYPPEKMIVCPECLPQLKSKQSSQMMMIYIIIFAVVIGGVGFMYYIINSG